MVEKQLLCTASKSNSYSPATCCAHVSAFTLSSEWDDGCCSKITFRGMKQSDEEEVLWRAVFFKAEVKNFSVVGSSLRFLRRRDCVTGSEAGVAETHRKWSEASLCSAWFINNTMSTIYTSSTFRFQFCKILNWDILTIFVIVFLVFF